MFWGVLTLGLCAISWSAGRDYGRAERPVPIRKPVLVDTPEGVPILEWKS